MLSFFSITQNFGIWCNFFFSLLLPCFSSQLWQDDREAFLFEILLNLKTKFWLQHCREKSNASSSNNSETFPLMESSESSRLLMLFLPPTTLLTVFLQAKKVDWKKQTQTRRSNFREFNLQANIMVEKSNKNFRFMSGMATSSFIWGSHPQTKSTKKGRCRLWI